MLPLTDSRPYLDDSLAQESSQNGADWEPLVAGMVVSSSRYALVLRSLDWATTAIDPNLYEVAVGPSEGSTLTRFLRGRVDKSFVLALVRMFRAPRAWTSRLYLFLLGLLPERASPTLFCCDRRSKHACEDQSIEAYSDISPIEGVEDVL